MTIYQISIITTTGYPFFNLIIRNLPKGIKLFLRFYDFSKERDADNGQLDIESLFDLNAGLISALFEFARNLDKKIDTLGFTSKQDPSNLEKSPPNIEYEGDVLITVQSETYLLARAVNQKVSLIYDSIIRRRLPLEAGEPINPAEEEKIIEILTDLKAKQHVLENKGEIEIVAKDYFKGMGEYGLESIIITSFDFSPIKVLGDKYSFNDIEIILRNIGSIPEIEPLQWKYRQSFYKGKQAWVYIINSGIGVHVDGLFEPYYYLIIATPESYLGEFPGKLAQSFNLILG